MGLKVGSISFRDFRNYDRYELRDIGDLTVLVGRNAIGKTNILEGVQLVTSASSFRHPQISQLVRDGCARGRVSAVVGDGNRELSCELVLEEGRRRFLVNGKVKAAHDMKGMVPAVTFTPDDLELAKGPAAVRRRALDEAGMQLNGNYYVIHRDYEKALRYKNRLLKDDAPQALVDAINETLVTCGAQLFCYRHALYSRMVPAAALRYGDIARTGEELSAGYVPSWDKLARERDLPLEGGIGEGGYARRDVVREIMREALAVHSGEERTRRRGLVGPHNDSIYFFVDGRDASRFASQGQQRSIVLAWKLAEVDLVRQMSGTEPLLLLDDVMSELDETRRDLLVGSMTARTQTFITATDLSSFNAELLGRARVIDLEVDR